MPAMLCLARQVLLILLISPLSQVLMILSYRSSRSIVNFGLIGALTTEVWIGTGAADFYFQQVQGAYINHGSASQYSIASQDVLVFFIQQDGQGNGLVLQGNGYDVTEISTPRIVKEFKSM
jgi:hypothetical protein